MNSSKLNTDSIHTDIVLIGGGHAHIEVIRNFGMKPEPGTRLTLISKEDQTLYSGMLPGLIANHYKFDDVHIDLHPLTHFANCRFFHSEVLAIDLKKNIVLCDGRPPVPFDVLSLDIGSAPSEIPDGHESVLPVKPINSFYEYFKNSESYSDQGQSRTVGIVGGGAGGVELAFAIKHRFMNTLNGTDEAVSNTEVVIITADDSILPTFPRSAQKHCMQALKSAGIQLVTGFKVVSATNNAVCNEAGEEIIVEHIVWATQASAPKWPGDCGLQTNTTGFVKVNKFLQAIGHKNIFAVGDIADVEKFNRPKSGVFAVRQGPILAKNLRHVARGETRLEKYSPQKDVLSLISLGKKLAIGTKYRVAFCGEWLWRLKKYIDKRFIERYTELPRMIETGLDSSDKKIIAEIMRCGGCGSKIGPEILQSALQKLAPRYSDPNVLVGLSNPDDAAVTRVPPGALALYTVDGFRDFLNDPFLFGQIAAVHALSDIYAMGGEPKTALAFATIPVGTEKLMADDLAQLMSGALKALSEDNVELIGGHSCEGLEMSLGLSINGYCSEKDLLKKSGAENNDAIILTKALGTGVIFAAMMQGESKAATIRSAVNMMLTSNKTAAQIFKSHETTAMTDVTGFGLCGHLIEMLSSSQLCATLSSAAIPVLPEAQSLFAKGYESSLHSQNLKLQGMVDIATEITSALDITFDPQTSGGLLGTVPHERAHSCLANLRGNGYTDAKIIGQVKPRKNQHVITLS